MNLPQTSLCERIKIQNENEITGGTGRVSGTGFAAVPFLAFSARTEQGAWRSGNQSAGEERRKYTNENEQMDDWSACRDSGGGSAGRRNASGRTGGREGQQSGALRGAGRGDRDGARWDGPERGVHDHGADEGSTWGRKYGGLVSAIHHGGGEQLLEFCRRVAVREYGADDRPCGQCVPESGYAAGLRLHAGLSGAGGLHGVLSAEADREEERGESSGGAGRSGNGGSGVL